MDPATNKREKRAFDRTTLDRLVAVLITGIILLGIYSWWQATLRARETGGVMRRMMGTMPGTDPIWYLFGTLLVASTVLGVYVLARDRLVSGARPDTRTVSGSGNEPTGRPADQSELAQSTTTSQDERPTTLSFLPEDERRIVEPVLDSPGLTQVELRGRSDFSKAKVSQAVSELEDRGLVYRERQGRTFRVFPGELIKNRDE